MSSSPAAEPPVSRPFYWLGRLILGVGRWKLVDGPMPPKAVIVGAPHTSNWDGIIALSAAYVLGLRFRWLGKQSLFDSPLAPLMRATGGIPIDRTRRKSIVDQVAEQFAAHERFYVIITPEGTRRRVPYWKSGFYHIAQTAGVPLMLSILDFGRREVGVGRILMLSGDIDADMAQIREFYADRLPRHPARAGEIRLARPGEK